MLFRSNLDARLRLQTREEIRRIQKETGITTVFVTHDQEEAMSISDRIVVMKDGVVQQIGAPQQVYDDPANLFVARFLGTPPINVFEGRVENGRLYIGKEAVLDLPDVADRHVFAGIRPEGFVPCKNGRFMTDLKGVEVMGRDVSIVSAHPECISGAIRAIVSSEDGRAVDLSCADVRFELKREKVFLFDAKSQERIPFAL